MMCSIAHRRLLVPTLCVGTSPPAASWLNGRKAAGKTFPREAWERGNRPRRGVVLIIVLVVIAMLSLAGYTFSSLMLNHREAAELSGEQVQARALVESGVDAARVYLTQDLATQTEDGGKYDNPTRFRGVLVRNDEDSRLRGRFTLVAPALTSEGELGGIRYGLENESTRLNLNALMYAEKTTPGSGHELLMALPGMTDDVADAILDWLDDDDTPREQGCEADYYASLSPPYKPKNGPLDSVEELLLVRGVTPELLFGYDVNRNGLVDSNEEGGSLGENVDSSDDTLARGWSAYLTLFSMEHNVTAQNEPRVYLNGDDMQKLYDDLLTATGNQDWATYIVAYRQNGPYTGSKSGKSSADGQLDFTKKGKVKLNQVLDLIGTKVQVKFKGAKDNTILESPFPEAVVAMNLYLPILMDHCTVNADTVIPGRININQAPRTILKGIPGMNDDIINEILSRRSPEPDEQNLNFNHETWLLSEGIVTLPEMREMMPFITGGGHVYRAQVVGYLEGGQAAARAEVILDATRSKTPILFWRDMTHLGRGFALETLGLEAEEAATE